MNNQNSIPHITTKDILSIAQLPSEFGSFKIHGYQNKVDNSEHVAIVKGDPSTFDHPVMVRIHSECLTGDALGSLRCDCRMQLQAALKMIEKAGQGIVIYLQQEGRGIGLLNKLKAYCLQDLGLDTVEANEHLGFASDLREYSMAAHILKDLGVQKIRLITNNPLKISLIETHKIEVAERVPIEITPNIFNIDYLSTKAKKMGHLVKPKDPKYLSRNKFNIDENLDYIWPALLEYKAFLKKELPNHEGYWLLSGGIDTPWKFYCLTENNLSSLSESNFLIFIDPLGNLKDKNTFLNEVSQKSHSIIILETNLPSCKNIIKDVVCITGKWEENSWQIFSLYLRILLAQRQAYLESRPFIMAHLAQTLDGKIAAINGDSRWISNEANLKHAHRLRALHDAVMVGADTAILDNPKLTVRLVAGEHPTPIIIEGTKALSLGSLDSNMLQLHKQVIILHPKDKERPPLSKIAQGKICFLAVQTDKNSDKGMHLNPRDILTVLYDYGINSIFLEGGGRTISYFSQSNCIEILHLHFSPIILGSGRPSFSLPVIDSISDGIRFDMKHFNLDGEILLELLQLEQEAPGKDV